MSPEYCDLMLCLMISEAYGFGRYNLTLRGLIDQFRSVQHIEGFGGL